MLEPPGLLVLLWKGIPPRRSRLGVPRKVPPEMVPPEDMAVERQQGEWAVKSENSSVQRGEKSSGS